VNLEIIQADFVQTALITVIALLVVITCVHAMLHKTDPRSAALWIVICLLFPLGGIVLYLVFGINRLNRRAQRRAAGDRRTAETAPPLSDIAPPDLLDYESLIRTTLRVTGLPLVSGCHLQSLFNGDEAFPEMLAAIRRANSWVYLSIYIFDHRGIGRSFIKELISAHQRGIQVRVIIDGIGEWYDGGKTRRLLRRQGIDARSFLPPRLLPPQLAINLRNHRKLLLVDGEVGFVGGMNIRPQHTHRPKKPLQIQDMVVKINGPVLQQLAQVAADDWRYVTGEQWTPVSATGPASGTSLCRAIPDGPEQSLDKLLAVLLGAIASARNSIRIMTPYFLPPPELDALLQAAARSGIQVTVVLPERSDHRMMHWASLHRLPAMIRAGINVYFQPLPFAHTKLLVIDNQYVQFGSANIDARSLRLNFELMVESYDVTFATKMIDHFDRILDHSQQVKSTSLNHSPLWKRIRNAGCWLFSPNL